MGRTALRAYILAAKQCGHSAMVSRTRNRQLSPLSSLTDEEEDDAHKAPQVQEGPSSSRVTLDSELSIEVNFRFLCISGKQESYSLVVISLGSQFIAGSP